MPRKALITGATGQDGAYLAEYLLSKNYIVHGIKRRASQFNTQRVDHLYRDRHEQNVRFFLHYGDMTDSCNLISLIQAIKPDEIYNLAAMSHVHVSFEQPAYTANVDGIGTLRLLEAIRLLEMTKSTKIYQASTSELYGNVNITPQNETTPFYPRSPYAAAKLYAYWITVNYREAYEMYACNGILFNHESPIRGETFVTKKITHRVAMISYGLSELLYLGNLDAKRDWGHAKDYVKAMHLMLQQSRPDDYVIATGEAHTVREFVIKAFSCVGITINFSGTGLEEIGYIKYIDYDLFKKKVGIIPSHLKNDQIILKITAEYFRPTEVDFLLGDASKAKVELGWKPEYTFDQLVKEMVDADLQNISKKHNVNTQVNSKAEQLIYE